MHKIVWPLAAVLMLLGTAAIWTLKSNKQYKPVLPGGVPRDITREELAALEDQWREEIQPATRPGSMAVTPQTEHDFGMLDFGYVGTHTFVVRNEGTQTLVLGDIKSNSDYVEGEFSNRHIEPGGQGNVTLRWQPAIRSGTFRGAVHVPTSDPVHPSLRFAVHGEMVRRLEAIPGSLNFGDIDPRKTPGTREALIISQAWDEFKILDSSCEMEAVQWEIQPAAADDLAEQDALSGYRLRVTMPENLPQGKNSNYIRLRVQPPTVNSEPIECQIRIACRVLRRLCVYGNELDRDGMLDMGLVRRGREKTALLRIKLRDEDTQLHGARVEIEPSFVQGEIAPYEEGVDGGYVLSITIPDDAPICTHLLPAERGVVRITSDHPRAKEQTLSLRFGVVGEGNAAALP